MNLRLHRCLLLMLSFFVLLAVAEPAFADILSINANKLDCGDYNPSTKQFNNGMQSLFNNTAIPAGTPMTPDAQLGGCTGGFFARFVCLVESTLGMVIATFFCSVQHQWVGPFAALLMIFMTGMGVMFITGMVEFTIKEVTVMMFKIALITTFAFNTDIALGIAFKFFLAITQNSVEVFGNVFTGSNHTTPIRPTFDMADAHVGVTAGNKPTPNCTFSGVAGVFGAGLFYVVLLFFLPFVFGIFLLATIAGLAFFARAAYGYLYSLVMLTFLIAAMPIFVGLALFATTRDIFDAWVKYLFSNTIQIMLVFAFLAYAGSVNVGDFITDISRLMTNYEFSFSTPPLSWVSLGTICTICTPNIIDDPYYLAMKPPIHVLMIAPSPHQCLNPDGIFWTDIIDQDRFIMYLITHGATVYMIAAVLSDLMKDVPEMSQKLGGSSASMMVGGISRKYNPDNPNSIKAPGLMNATMNFEKSFANAWKSGKSFDKEGQHWAMYLANRTAPMRLLAAVAGTYKDMKYGTSNLSKSEARRYAQTKRVGKAHHQQRVLHSKSEVKRHEMTIENLEKAKAELKAKNEASQKVIEEMRKEAQAFKLLGDFKSPALKALEEDIMSREQSLQKREQALVAMMGQIIDLDSKIEKKQGESPEGKKDIKARDDEVAALKEERDQLFSKYAEEENALSRERQEINTKHDDYQVQAKQEIDAQVAENEKQLEELRKKIEEMKEKAKTKEEEEEYQLLLKQQLMLEEQIAAAKSIDTPLALLEYRIEEMKLKENTLALNETEASLSSNRTALEGSEKAVERAEQDAAEWDRKTSDERFARGQFDLNYKDPSKDVIGHHGGFMEDLWGSASADQYFTNAEYIRKHGSKREEEFAWSSLMHMGEH